MRSLDGNPLLDGHRRARSDPGGAESRGALLARYGFAVPDERALAAVARHSPAGVVELGAGTGYWARLLHDRGLDVVAYDVEPPPSAANPWFAGQEPWFDVQRGDQAAVEGHRRRTLLLVWPTRDEVWPADALARYHAAGGGTVVVVGEGPGGRTGDDVFHAMLGLTTTCVACDLGIVDQPCVCGVRADWQLVEHVELLHWPGFEDDLRVHVRRDGADPIRPRRRRRRSV